MISLRWARPRRCRLRALSLCGCRIRIISGWRETYRVKRDRMLAILEKSGFECFKPSGAYYVMTDITRFGFTDDVTFARYLVEEIGVAVVPGSSFYNDAVDGAKQVRFTYCKTEQTLAAAAERLAKLSAR